MSKDISILIESVEKGSVRIEKVRAEARKTAQEIYTDFLGREMPEKWVHLAERFASIGYSGKVLDESDNSRKKDSKT